MKKACIYCNTCHNFYCTSCKCGVEGHQSSHIPLQFNENQLVAKCREHDAIAKFVCCETKMICIYCRYRNHLNHQQHYETISCHANRILELVSIEEGGVRKSNGIMINAKKHLNLAKFNIKLFRESLTKVLKKKKIEYISKHASIAEADERRILNEFDNLLIGHVQRYPDLHESDLIKNCIDMEELELFANKEQIIDEVIRFTHTIPTLTIGLTDGINESAHPLGDLTVSQGEDVKISNNNITSTVATSITESNVEKVSELVEKLKDMMKEGKVSIILVNFKLITFTAITF